jgi:hypothetical protein
MAVNNSMVPRRHFQIIGSGPDFIDVIGCEVIHTLMNDNSGATAFSARINPLEMSLSRLSGISRSWEKFVFSELELVYTPGCPSTQSGWMAMCISENPVAMDPVDPVEFAAYEYSSIGSVALPARTRVSTEPEKRLWFVSPRQDGTAALGGVDPTNRYQGKVVVATGGNLSAVIQLAGWVSLEYRCRLYNLRPAFDATVIGSTGLSQSYLGGTATTQGYTMDRLLNGVGNWLWEDTADLRPLGAVATTDPDPSYRNSFVGSALEYAMEYALTLGSATTEDYEEVKLDRYPLIYPAIVSTRGRYQVLGRLLPGVRLRIRGQLDKKECDHEVVEAEEDSKGGRRTIVLRQSYEGKFPVAVTDVCYVPTAAHDVTIVCRETAMNDNTNQVRYSRLYNAAGGLVVSDSTRFSAPPALNSVGLVYQLLVVPVGTELRALSTNDFNQFGLTVVDPIEQGGV